MFFIGTDCLLGVTLSYFESKLLELANLTSKITVPSLILSSTSVTVTVLGLFQLEGVMTNAAGDTVPWVVLSELVGIITFEVGIVARVTVI